MPRNVATTQDQTDERPDNCPICDEPVERVDRPDPVTYALRPCGHQVDEHVYEDLLAE